jgi:general secretion pathway protein A
MYLDYFGLKETPFSIAPDPRYLYMSERHREALAHLLYGVSGQGGFVVLTGEVGTGKTTICRCFLNQVPKNTDVAFIINPKLSARELMASICDELSLKYPESASIKVLNDLINSYLLTAHSENRHTVLIIDEAQNLRVDVLEQLRLLTNLETSEKKLLQIILLGQPELRDILAQNELRQLSQRVTARYHLNELNKVEVGAYVQCRLAVAGRRGRLFDQKATKLLFQLSGGVPRLINLISDRALLGAYASQSDMVEPSHIRSAYREIQGDKPKRTFRLNLKQKYLSSLLTGLLFLVVMSVFINNQYTQKIDQLEAAITDLSNVSEGANPEDETAALNNKSYQPTRKNDSARETNSYTKVTKSTKPAVITKEKIDEVVDERPRSSSAPVLDQITGLRASKLDKFGAYEAIFERWGVQYNQEPFMLACNYAEMYGLRCLHKNGNWRSLLKLNRPAVLKITNEIGESLYFGLMAIEGEQALISHQDKKYWIGLDEIDRYWLGEYSVLWKLPPYLSGIVLPGQNKRDKWLKTNLSRLNRSESTKRHSVENLIKQFQLNVGLQPDGIAGSMTIIHMNSRLCLDCPKLLNGK